MEQNKNIVAQQQRARRNQNKRIKQPDQYRTVEERGKKNQNST